MLLIKQTCEIISHMNKRLAVKRISHTKQEYKSASIYFCYIKNIKYYFVKLWFVFLCTHILFDDLFQIYLQIFIFFSIHGSRKKTCKNKKITSRDEKRVLSDFPVKSIWNCTAEDRCKH